MMKQMTGETIKKTAVIVYRWIIISVLAQLLILLLINNVYLSDKGDLKSRLKLEVIAQMGEKETSIKVTIPENAANIKTSFDNAYVAYMLKEKLEIVNTQNGKVVKTISHSKDNITFYRWLPDRNMIIYALKPIETEPVRVQVVTYNVDSDLEHIMPKISTNILRGSEITDIVFSPLTKVTYVKVKVNEQQARIYRYNIMDELSFAIAFDAKITIKEASYTDLLLYQDEKNRVIVRDGLKFSNTPLQLPQMGKAVLVDIDEEDKVYIGELNDDGKLARMFYSKVPLEAEKSWEEISFKKPPELANVLVSSEGKLYEISEGENAIYDITSGSTKKISYKGKFVELSNNYIVTIEKDKLSIAPIK